MYGSEAAKGDSSYGHGFAEGAARQQVGRAVRREAVGGNVQVAQVSRKQLAWERRTPVGSGSVLMGD